MEGRSKRMKCEVLKTNIERYCNVKYGKSIDTAENYEIFNAVSLALLEGIVKDWNATTKLYNEDKRAYYISAEYLMGRALGNNIICMNNYEEVIKQLR